MISNQAIANRFREMKIPKSQFLPLKRFFTGEAVLLIHHHPNGATSICSFPKEWPTEQAFKQVLRPPYE